MARHLIQNTTTGDTRIVGDAALPFFPGYIIKDTLEDGQPPFQYYSGGESDLRYVNVSELSDPESAPSVALRAAFVSPGHDFPLPQRLSSDAQIASVVLADSDPTSPGDGLTFTRLDGERYEFAVETEAEWRPWFGDGGLVYSETVAGMPSILAGTNRDGIGAGQWVIRARTNAPWLLLRGHFAGSGAWDGTLQIRVNGVPIWAKPRYFDGTYDGSPGNLEIQFQDDSFKTVEIFHTCTRLYTLNWPTGSTTSPWSPTGQKKLNLLGDSWAGGTDQAGTVGSFARQLQRTVSWDVSYNGQGGTGYVSGGTNPWNCPFTDTRRVTALTENLPDVLVVLGSINDRGKTGIQAAATSLYSAVATASPATKIIVIGAQFAEDGGTAVNATLEAAANAAPNVIGFVDPIAEQWIVPGVTGPTDTVHPSAAGAEYLAYKVEQTVRRLTVAAGDTSW